MIGTLWLAVQWAALALIGGGVIFHRWTGWCARPWWYAVAALTSVDVTWQCLLAGRTALAAVYSLAALLALAGFVLAARRERIDQPRHAERWDPWR